MIENATLLVTGANRGLGRALVTTSLQRGARRIYAGARDVATLTDLVRIAPERVVPLALDVTDPASLQAAAARAQDVSLLVNNAGVLASFGILTSTRTQLEQDFATNFFGVLAMSQAFLPALERAAEARIVNVLSIVSLANMPAIGGYSAAKAAAHSVTQALRAELQPKGIRVHAVFPGPIDTDMIRDFAVPKTHPDQVARAILTGVERDDLDIFPDPAAQEMGAVWRHDPKELEQRLSGL